MNTSTILRNSNAHYNHSNSTEVGQLVQAHILEAFTPDYGWDKGSNPLDNLRQQMEAFSYLPSDYRKGLEWVQGGPLLVYTEDIEDFLQSELGLTPTNEKYASTWDRYCNIVAKEVANLLAGRKTNHEHVSKL